jgi:hypothetical protein
MAKKGFKTTVAAVAIGSVTRSSNKETGDDTSALQALLDAVVPGATLDLGVRTYIVDAQLNGRALEKAKLVGQATLIARDGTDFEFILDISGTRGVEIEGLTFDANKTGRRRAAGKLSCLKANATIGCKLTACTFKNSLGITGAKSKSSVAVSASGGCQDLLVYGCTVLDCGLDANTKPSDGIFVRGDRCVVSNCDARNVTDTAFVLEGCNHSQIVNCKGTDCTSVAGMSNDTSQDVEGNAISGITATCNYFGSFGAVVGAMAFGTGKLRLCAIRDITITAAEHTKGGGPAMYLFGPVEDVTISNVTIDGTGSAGAMNHGLAIDDAQNVDITASSIRASGIGACIRIGHAAAGIRIEGNLLENGAAGIFADGTSRFSESRNIFVNCMTRVQIAGLAEQV